ncbi:ATPase P, partial [Vibrio campbellii]
PCALSLATPTALTCATSRLGSLGILLRKNHVFETLCKVNHLVVDKTGTLTEGNIAIKDMQIETGFETQSCIDFAKTLESHANHPIANAFKGLDGLILPAQHIENKIGQGIEGVISGFNVKIGSAR